MNTHNSIKKILNNVGSKDLIISSLGRTAEELFTQATNHDQILFIDCLGAVSGLGIGIALACENTNVFVFDTDGSFIYNPSVLNTISKEKNKLRNLKVFIFDNEILESAGQSPSYSANIDWLRFIGAWGIPSEIIRDENQIEMIMEKFTQNHDFSISIVKISNYNIKNTCMKDIDGIESRYRFKRFINNNINGGIIKPCLKN